MKLEMFIFDIFQLAEKWVVLEVCLNALLIFVEK